MDLFLISFLLFPIFLSSVAGSRYVYLDKCVMLQCLLECFYKGYIVGNCEKSTNYGVITTIGIACICYYPGEKFGEIGKRH
ncbi:unnamed protein product [Cylicocyclus nassatus]|uniref:Uncharacterized protein n=1 Tax=Cylicocyclus nassatus TaxID=53992 RepID=A0AA36GII4_CYLNA|nr:unnamed protein product [Cylicocyclus nassatus]